MGHPQTMITYLDRDLSLAIGNAVKIGLDREADSGYATYWGEDEVVKRRMRNGGTSWRTVACRGQSY
jgi:hypothetical protein